MVSLMKIRTYFFALFLVFVTTSVASAQIANCFGIPYTVVLAVEGNGLGVDLINSNGGVDVSRFGDFVVCPGESYVLRMVPASGYALASLSFSREDLIQTSEMECAENGACNYSFALNSMPFPEIVRFNIVFGHAITDNASKNENAHNC